MRHAIHWAALCVAAGLAIASPNVAAQQATLCPGGVVVLGGNCPSTGYASADGFGVDALDVAASDAAEAWLRRDGHVQLVRYTSAGAEQHAIPAPANARRLAVTGQAGAALDGIQIWVVDASSAIFRGGASGNWERMPGAARDVGANSQGVVWVIGVDGAPYRWNPANSSWVQGSGSGASIAVDAGGNPWVTNAEGAAWRFDGSQWIQLPGSGSDISIASNGTAYIVGASGALWRGPGGNWDWQKSTAVAGRVAGNARGFIYSGPN
jgi:hypothetical protein